MDTNTNRVIQIITICMILTSCKCCFSKSRYKHGEPPLAELTIQRLYLDSETSLFTFLEQEKNKLTTELNGIYNTLPNKDELHPNSNPQKNLELEGQLKKLNHVFEILKKANSLLLSTPAEDYTTYYDSLSEMLEKIQEIKEATRKKIEQLKTKIQAGQQNSLLEEKEGDPEHISIQEQLLKFYTNLLQVCEQVEEKLALKRQAVQVIVDRMLSVS